MLNESLIVVAYFDQTNGHTVSSSDLTIRESRSVTGSETLAMGDDFPATVAITRHGQLPGLAHFRPSYGCVCFLR